MGFYKNIINPTTGKLQRVFNGVVVDIKPGVADSSSLPLTGNTKGDARIAHNNGHMYIWGSSSSFGSLSDWDDNGDIIDLEWDAIDGKPSSTPTNIDDAVSKKHLQGSDTTLGSMSANVDMNSHKLTGLAVPSSNGDSIRATTKITESNLEDSVDKKHTQNSDTILDEDGTNEISAENLVKGGINFIIDGGGDEITTGVKGYVRVPFGCTIQEVVLLADQSGSIVVDIWKCSYSDFDSGSNHPVNGDSITASAEPTISTAKKYQDNTLTGWTTSVSEGDILAFNVDSITDITRCTVVLKVKRV